MQSKNENSKLKRLPAGNGLIEIRDVVVGSSLVGMVSGGRSLRLCDEKSAQEAGGFSTETVAYA
jgi:hypothetical protein